ncbi:DNA cytosine methyltransferase [Colwellia sp. MB3u-70]|nr:DNA cytosine methyltransferase [Colwellia sp. MB3u-8]MBA6307110.1 DNA cytosine methyltransferase [Colwellia sp. MB3u-70]
MINRNKPEIVSLFSGCGGMDIGFEDAGFNVVFANDIEKSVKAPYEAYFKKPILIKDISLLDIDEDIPSCDLVLAGIPCQPFSNAGNRGSMEDDRGSLFEHVINVLDKKRPKVVIFENVRGFTSAKDDKGVPMPERLKAEMKLHDYECTWELLNASDFGVPQNRYRVVIVGVRKDIYESFGPFKFPEKIQDKSHLTVDSVISNPLPEGEEHEHWKLSPQALHLEKFIPEGGSWKSVPIEELPERLLKIRREMKRYRSPNFYRRFARHEIMGTITAAATPENSGILHPLKSRRYCVREIARFQSFPDSYKFIGSSTAKKYKMIGNAVPPKFAKTIAESISSQYFSAKIKVLRENEVAEPKCEALDHIAAVS